MGEVSVMTNDLMMYRNELARVAELLAHQLGRERQLHGMLETMAGHHATLASSTMQAASQQPDKDQLHNMVEAMFGQHQNNLQATFQGMSQANEISQHHASQANQLKEPMINAENELNRILQMLGSAPIQNVTPAPTTAVVPQAMPPGPYRGPMMNPRPGFAGSPVPMTGMPVMVVNPNPHGIAVSGPSVQAVAPGGPPMTATG